MKKKVRVIDVMTKDELVELAEYKSKIGTAKTPFGISKNKRRAQALLRKARCRYEQTKDSNSASL